MRNIGSRTGLPDGERPSRARRSRIRRDDPENGPPPPATVPFRPALLLLRSSAGAWVDGGAEGAVAAPAGGLAGPGVVGDDPAGADACAAPPGADPVGADPVGADSVAADSVGAGPGCCDPGGAGGFVTLTEVGGPCRPSPFADALAERCGERPAAPRADAGETVSSATGDSSGSQRVRSTSGCHWHAAARHQFTGSSTGSECQRPQDTRWVSIGRGWPSVAKLRSSPGAGDLCSSAET